MVVTAEYSHDTLDGMEGLQHSTAFFFRGERSPPKQLSGVRNSEIKVSSPCNCNDEIRFRQSRNKPTKRLEKVSGQEYRKPRNSVQVRFSLISEGKDFPGVCQCYGSTSFRIDVDHLFIRKSGDQSRDDSKHHQLGHRRFSSASLPVCCVT